MVLWMHEITVLTLKVTISTATLALVRVVLNPHYFI